MIGRYTLFNFIRNRTFKRLIKYLTVVLFTLSFISCITEIEPSSANSAAAIIATIGEYVYAIIALIFFYLFHLIRIAGTTAVTYSLYYLLLSNGNSNIINPSLSLIIGFSLIIISLMSPTKLYQPRVIISKHAGKEKTKINNRSKGLLYDLGLGVLLGVILLLIENFMF